MESQIHLFESSIKYCNLDTGQQRALVLIQQERQLRKRLPSTNVWIGLRSGFLDSELAAFSCMGLKIDDLDNVRCKYEFYHFTSGAFQIVQNLNLAFCIPVGPVVVRFPNCIVYYQSRGWGP